MRSRFSFYLSVIGLSSGLALSTPAKAQTYTPIDYPGGNTRPTLASGTTFTTIDFPGAYGTLAAGINRAGAIVGDFIFNNGGNPHGFLFSGGTFTQLDCPSANFTRATGIDDSSNVVGYCRVNGQFHGFLLQSGVYNLLDFPGAVNTQGRGSNNLGEIVGLYCAAKNTQSCGFTGGNQHGFLLSGGAYTSIDFPGAIYTELWRINDFGEILGRYLNPDGSFHLFLLNNGIFTPVPDVPGATETAFGITFVGGLNRQGAIVSDYCGQAPCPFGSADFFSLPGSTHGFLLRDGAYTTIDFPGAGNTVAFGINDAGEIVGGYFNPDGHDHGFLRTP